jgi:CheY-like chemotaxis protein
MERSSVLDHQSKLVLLIEDNTDDERLTLRALRKNNVMNEVIVACDGQEAVDYLYADGKFAGRDTSLLPSVIILDLKLPKLDGLSVLEKIRQHESTRFTPVIVLTASEDQEKMRAAYAKGANSYVYKPTDPDQYVDTILNTVMYWLLLNRVAE